MKYARRRITSSNGSPNFDGSVDGSAEISVFRSAGFFVAVAFGFLVVVARRPLRRLAVFLVMLGPPDSAGG
jgi:hypothetical protein